MIEKNRNFDIIFDFVKICTVYYKIEFDPCLYTRLSVIPPDVPGKTKVGAQSICLLRTPCEKPPVFRRLPTTFAKSIFRLTGILNVNVL